MAEQLLIRSYHVRLGDCIYVKIPDGGTGFHMLIDCGTLNAQEALRTALADLVTHLPRNAADKPRLDLLVATHPHEDHVVGFAPELFENIEVRQVWLSAIMDTDRPERAQNTNRLHEMVMKRVEQANLSGLSLSPELETMLGQYNLDNDQAFKALREGLGTDHVRPKYVHGGMRSDDADLNLNLNAATIHVLAPEENIDEFYFGDDGGNALNGFDAASTRVSESGAPAANVKPANISAADFRLLQTRLLSNTLAFADVASRIMNSLSVVLLIEWRNRRLLFVGDAEWHSTFKMGKENGSWNVMWNVAARKALLKSPLDFLKIGHHGSINATPWNSRNAQHEVNAILDAILPLPVGANTPTAQAIVSTARANYVSVPAADLLVELGRRTANPKQYETELRNKGRLDRVEKIAGEDGLLNLPQPLRTDLEYLLTDTPYVEVKIEPGD